MHVVLLALMQVNRLLVERGKCARIIHFADDARLTCRFHNHEIVRADASQGNGIGRIGIIRPVPLVSCAMNEAAILQEVENLGNVVAAELLVRAERQLESCALKVVDQDMNVVGIDQTHLGRLAQKILRMIHDELIQRRAGRHQDRDRHSAPPAGAAHSLPSRSDRPRIAGQDGHIQAADINPPTHWSIRLRESCRPSARARSPGAHSEDIRRDNRQRRLPAQARFPANLSDIEPESP